MAISKTQPMRPAEIELINKFNQIDDTESRQDEQIAVLNTAIENEAQTRLNAVRNLQTQIGDGFTESSVTQSLSTTNAQLLALADDVDTIEQTTIPNLQAQVDTIDETTIPNIQAQIDTIDDTTIPSIQAQVDTIDETTIPNIQAQVDTIDQTTIPNLQTQVDTINQTTIPSIQAQIDTINQTTIPNITASLGNTALLDDTVVNSILELATNEEALEGFTSRFKIACINNITIPANDSISTSASFAEPFDANDVCVLFAQVITSEVASLFTYTLIDCTYSGFSYSIANSDSDAHTVSLGYVAIKVN